MAPARQGHGGREARGALTAAGERLHPLPRPGRGEQHEGVRPPLARPGDRERMTGEQRPGPPARPRADARRDARAARSTAAVPAATETARAAATGSGPNQASSFASRYGSGGPESSRSAANRSARKPRGPGGEVLVVPRPPEERADQAGCERAAASASHRHRSVWGRGTPAVSPRSRPASRRGYHVSPCPRAREVPCAAWSRCSSSSPLRSPRGSRRSRSSGSSRTRRSKGRFPGKSRGCPTARASLSS